MDEQINLGINVESGDVKTLGNEFDKVDESVQNILEHLSQLEKKIKKIPSINNIVTTKISGGANAVVGANGTAFSHKDKNSEDFRKAAEEYHALQQEEIKLLKERIRTEQEIANREKELAAVVRQDSDSRKKKADASLLRAQKEQDRNSKAFLDAQAARTKMFNESVNWRAYREKHPELFVTGGQNVSWRLQGAKALTNVGNKVSSGGIAGRVIGDVMSTAGALLKAPAAGLMTAFTKAADAALDFAKAAVQAYSEIESIKTQLGVVFSNQTEANAMFGEISQYAVKSPFGVQQTSELAVLLKQSGVYASDLMSTLKMIGDTAGGNMEKMKRIANNYAQIVSIGKASMLDMRQFAYAGIPIFEAVSKELGVSQQQLRKLISEGKVTSDIIEKVFKDLTGVNGIFENATEKGAKTLKARLQNLKDAKQLAMASAGERIVKLGSNTGNDSIITNLVSSFEEFFQWMKEHNDTVNIGKDVKIIAKRNTRITELQELVEKNKDNKDLRKIFEAELKRELAKRDYDVERNTYAQSFDLKQGRWAEALKAMGDLSIDDAVTRRNALSSRIGQLSDGNRYQSFDWKAAEMFPLYNQLDKSEAEATYSLYKELVAALKEVAKVTEEEIKADRERTLIQAQSLAYDQMNRKADASGSLMNDFRELTSLYRESDEYKLKEEEAHQKKLNEALEQLKIIAKNTDETGKVDITKFSSYQLKDLIDKGAFSATEKLNVVTGNSAVDSENRALLMQQYGDVSSKIYEFLQAAIPNVQGAQGKGFEFDPKVMEGLRKLSDTDFYEEFPKIYNRQVTALNELIKIFPKQRGREVLQDYKELLNYSLNRIETDTGGINATPTKKKSGTAQEFIPLWKRILASATGLSTQGMTGTKQTMENYRDDMAIRNMTAGVLSSTFKAMGMDTTMSLLKTKGNALQLRGDTGYTYQVDWKETKKAIHDFATQLSASTEVITAYKKGLEDELEVYEKLVVAGFTESESQDLNQQKFISAKTIEKFSKDSRSQLVNAFGEALETSDGIKVTYKNGNWYDAEGNKVQVEELKMTGNLFKFIKEELPRLRNEIHEANVTMLNNQILNKMEKTAIGQNVIKNYTQEYGYNNKLKFLLENEDYSKGVISSYISAAKAGVGTGDENQIKLNGELQFNRIASLSEDDIIAKANMFDTEIYKKMMEERNKLEAMYEDGFFTGSEEEEKRLEEINNDLLQIVQSYLLLKDAIADVNTESDSLLNSDLYKSLYETNRNAEREKAVTAALLDISNYQKYKTTNPEAKYFRPENYEGSRGSNARFLKWGYGASRDYDMEDLYIQAALSKNLEGKNTNQFGIDSSRFYEKGANGEMTLKAEFQGEEGLQNILDSLTKADEEIIKMNQSLIDTADIFTELGATLHKTFTDLGKGAWEKPFEKMGENLVIGEKATEGLDEVFQNLSASLLSASGEAMVKAGWDLVSRGALDGNYAMIAGGLALAATGGFVSGLGAGLTQKKDDKNDDSDKLNKLKDDLIALLKQAREDSIYYENTLRHKRALSSNDSLNIKNVHDAIITPRGDVVNTDPKDYLIATKTPKTLIGGGAPTINFNVIDKSTGIVVTQQKSSYDTESNSIDFEAIIESKVQEVIASPKGDDAFTAREMRINGRQVIA